MRRRRLIARLQNCFPRDIPCARPRLTSTPRRVAGLALLAARLTTLGDCTDSVAEKSEIVYERSHCMYEYFSGAVLTCILLLIEHFSFWHIRLSRLVRHTMGVVALNSGISLALFLREQPWEIVGLWAISGIGGALVAGLHLWRAQRGEEPGEIESASLAGGLVKQARGLSRADKRES